jgi:hypothetical protein
MFAQQVGQWFKGEPRELEVKIGAVFRNARRGNIIEIAKVLDIAPDSMGVPHVHYSVSVRSAHHECFEEQRTLGLASFAERFSKALLA